MRKHFCLFLLASIFYSYATLAQNASAKKSGGSCRCTRYVNDPGGRYLLHE